MLLPQLSTSAFIPDWKHFIACPVQYFNLRRRKIIIWTSLLNIDYEKVSRIAVGPEPRPPPEPQYDYPWVGPNEKSMVIDLAEFEELDAYAQKVDVKDSVKNLVSALLEKAHSDLEKVRAIWVWVCSHIEYDTEGCRNKKNLRLKPIDVLQSGKTICSGFSLLFAKMCSTAGVPCECLVGLTKKLYRHAWNAVHIDGKWHLLDCTWGRCKDHGRCDDLHFLMHPALFAEDHFPHDPRWMLLKQPMKYAVTGFFYKRKMLK